MPRMTIEDRDAILSPATGLIIYQTNGAAGYHYYDGTAWEPLLAEGADDLGNHLYTQNMEADGNWLSGDGDDEGIFVTDEGNVGIGTEVPAALLQIENSTIDNSVQDLLRLQVHNNASGNGGGIQFANRWNNSGSAYWTMARMYAIEQNGYGGQLIFETNNGTGSADHTTIEAMRIDENGRVGIGTTSPSEKLHSEGNLRLANGAYIDDDATMGGNSDDWIRLNGYVEMKSNSDNYGLVLRDKDNTQYMAITQKNGWSYFSDNAVSGSYFLRGNGANVDVRGDLRVFGSDVYDNSGELRLSGEDNVKITMDYNNNDADSRAIIFGKNNMVNPTELMRIDEDGNVGIGTSTPS